MTQSDWDEAVVVPAWLAFLVIAGMSAPPARATESPARPTIVFLGVYDAAGNDARSHTLEALVGRELKSSPQFDVKLPADLDAGGLDSDARQELLASAAPQRRFEPYRDLLGNDVLVLRIEPAPPSQNATELIEGKLFRVADGSELLSRPIAGVNDEAVKAFVQGLRLLLAPGPAPAAPPEAVSHVRLTHEPVETVAPGTPAVIEATADGPGNWFVAVDYRQVGDQTWHQEDLVRVTGNRYAGSLPPLAAGAWEYFVHVEDENLNRVATSGSLERPHRLVVAAVPDHRSSLTPRAQAVAPSSTPSSHWSWQRKVGIATAIAGGVAVVAGIAFGVDVRQHESHVTETFQPGATALREVNTINTEAPTANGLMIAGGVVAAAGAGLAIAF